jgi:RimJ/RimL family protein N-acetyltransferase
MNLRRPTAADAATLVPLWEDPQVMRFLGGACDPEEAARRFDNVLQHWDDHGFGRGVVEAPEPIGLCGITRLDDDLELTFMFFPAVWGKGIAREAAERTLHEVTTEIVALTHEGNHASQRLLERLGFVRRRSLVRWDAPQRWCVRPPSAAG